MREEMSGRDGLYGPNGHAAFCGREMKEVKMGICFDPVLGSLRTKDETSLKPITQNISVSGLETVTIDPKLYGRLILTGSGTVIFALDSTAEDGDTIQLVLDTNGITPVFPAAWVTLGMDIVTDPGLYVLEITKVETTVFYKVLYPDSQGSGRDGMPGASAYEVALANGFSGTEAQWLASLKGDTGETGSLNVVVSSTAPVNPTDGMIWIQG